ncbi:HNH endonuclease [Natronorubrum sp. FCH18a]|uniref:HNH endonuclease n=1 Tax=Natronorubrum sp. FCH18a TaxID=3447018 RepID=UPI003F514DE7
MEVDHIQRIADGGHPLEESNLQTLCEDCHTEKTADENSGPNRKSAPSMTLEDYLESSTRHKSLRSSCYTYTL